MTALYRRIKPYSFPITIDIIARLLRIPKSLIVRAECWAYVLFVHRHDKGGQFISYRKLAQWLESIVQLIQETTTFDDLWQLGLWIKQESEKFDYTKLVLEYLRDIWAKHRDHLRTIPKPESA
jgi:hypothetical protein